MEEILAFLGIIVCVVVIGSFISLFIILGRTGDILEKVDFMHKRFIALSTELSQLKAALSKEKSEEPLVKTAEKKNVVQEQVVPPIVVVKEPDPVIPPVEIPIEIKKEPVFEPTQLVDSNIRIGEKIPAPTFIPAPKSAKPKAPSFFERNPDLEKFIGENLINKIGIAILVIGIGFFVKFAIDQEWINEIGRVLIGIVCGGILVSVAHYTRNSFRSFSAVLVGGGIALFYLTIAIAFHEYKLMPQTAAFIIMVIITLFAVLLSITYDRKELAVIAIIGGFGSPFMVSTGEGNYQVLFGYILLLNIGMLVLAYFKRWNVVNVICFVFTVLLFGSWLGITFNNPLSLKPYMGALLFATAFYLTFFTMNIINNVKENKTFLGFELTLLIANTFLYYSAGMFLLQSIGNGLYQGLFTLVIALFNFVFAYLLYKNKKIDPTLVYLLIGLVLTFVTLSAPIQLEGNYITLFWAAETVLLLWLSQKSGIRIMKFGSFIILGLMIISLFMDWNNVYWIDGKIILILFNKGFITTIVALGALYSTLLLLRNEEENLFQGLDKKSYTTLLELLFILIGYVGGLLEVYCQFDLRVTSGQDLWEIIPIYTGCYNLAYLLLLSIYIHFRKVKWMEVIPVFLCILISIVYLIYYNPITASVRDFYLLSEPALAKHFYFHYVNVFLLVLLLANATRIIALAYQKTTNEFRYFLWFICFIAVYLASAELENSVVCSSYETGTDLYSIKHQNYKVGFPILWGICSFTLMLIGMKLKIKTLRIVGLTLFGVALLKLFVFDIQEMSEGGKIAAFISLGILLLIISFMYQKLKKIVTEE